MVSRFRPFLLLFALACASTPPGSETLRVLVYNIHAGRDAEGRENLDRVAALVAATRADVVLLQEVDRGTRRAGGRDQLAELERLTGYQGAFGKSLDYQGGEYGIAVLSRWPVVGSEVIPLRTEPAQARAGGSLEPRIALSVTVASPRGRLEVVNTHLDASRDERWRLQEVARLAAWLAQGSGDPRLVGGDFNAEPASVVFSEIAAAGLRDAWGLCGEGSGLTFPASGAVKRIDYLFLTGEGRCREASVVETEASDHRPLVVEVDARSIGLR